GRESQVDIDRDHGEIRVTLGGAVKPSGWPASVPIYPHAERAKIEKSEKSEAQRENGGAQRLSVATEDTLHELRDYHRDALPQAGWQLAAADETDAAWSARRGDEDLTMRFARRGGGKGSRADIEYRKRS